MYAHRYHLWYLFAHEMLSNSVLWAEPKLNIMEGGILFIHMLTIVVMQRKYYRLPVYMEVMVNIHF